MINPKNTRRMQAQVAACHESAATSSPPFPSPPTSSVFSAACRSATTSSFEDGLCLLHPRWSQSLRTSSYHGNVGMAAFSKGFPCFPFLLTISMCKVSGLTIADFKQGWGGGGEINILVAILCAESSSLFVQENYNNGNITTEKTFKYFCLLFF